MAFVKKKDLKIGDFVTTTRIIESFAGYFEIGTKVKIVGESERGYDIEDEEGNRIIECGWEL